MKEYDFRFPGLDPVRDSSRVRMLRDALLGVAGGFTEINPGSLGDLIPGDGLGYVIALDEEGKLKELADKLGELARAWRVKPPSVFPASDGPRGNHCFFLIPRRANRDLQGHRRDLFSPEKWARLKEALMGKLSHPVQLVYGEWMPQESYRKKDSDVSYIFIFKLGSDKDVESLRCFIEFIEAEVFDGGRECDQEAIYLSVWGDGIYVHDPSTTGDPDNEFV